MKKSIPPCREARLSQRFLKRFPIVLFLAGAAAGSGPTVSLSLFHLLEPAVSLEAEFRTWSRAGLGAVAQVGRDTLVYSGKGNPYAEAGGAAFAYPFGDASIGLQLGWDARIRYYLADDGAGGQGSGASTRLSSALFGGCRFTWSPGFALTARLEGRAMKATKTVAAMHMKDTGVSARADLMVGWAFL